MGAEASLEVLSAGSERNRWRRSTAVAVALVLAVVAAVAWQVDRSRQAAETARLRACVAAMDEASIPARRRVSAMADYVRPAFREGTPPETVVGLYALVARTAGEAAAAIEPARRGCAAVAVWPWHDAQERARAASLTYLDLQLELFRASAVDGARWFASNPDLVGARERVGTALP